MLASCRSLSSCSAFSWVGIHMRKVIAPPMFCMPPSASISLQQNLSFSTCSWGVPPRLRPTRLRCLYNSRFGETSPRVQAVEDCDWLRIGDDELPHSSSVRDFDWLVTKREIGPSLLQECVRGDPLWTLNLEKKVSIFPIRRAYVVRLR